MKNNQCTCH